jgi:hypothetical protein
MDLGRMRWVLNAAAPLEQSRQQRDPAQSDAGSDLGRRLGPRVDEVRLRSAGSSALVRRRLCRGGAAAFVAVIGVLAPAVFPVDVPLL